ncbi:MAG: BtaA family protein [Planctomycetota bacterium]
MPFDWIANRCFQAVHRRHLVYNTCWEDPRLDRRALEIDSRSRLLTITSAGCNTLDYLLDAPERIDAVDVNPLQNALLALKIASIGTLDHDDFFQIFGNGQHPRFGELYRDQLRPHLGRQWREIWDQRQDFFDGSHRRRPSFYFRGTSGWFAYQINRYLRRHADLSLAVDELLAAPDVETQRQIYADRQVDKLLWRRPLVWTLRRDTTMALLGVPRSQRRQIDEAYPGGLGGFIQDRIRRVFQFLPLADNYFWRVYLTGRYTRECCPEYLRKENFAALGAHVDRIRLHSTTIEAFLRSQSERGDTPVNRLVLLDHMDWMVANRCDLLQQEWQAIVQHTAADSRVLWRSAAPTVDFVDPIEIDLRGRMERVGDRLQYHDSLASRLHEIDRVQTYGSFRIADLQGTAA